MPRQTKPREAKKLKVVATQELTSKLSATRGLQDALGLQQHQRVFNEIRTNLRRLADRTFDFRCGPLTQTEESWMKFQNKIYEMYPRFKKRPQEPVQYYLRKYTKQYIGVVVWKMRKSNPNKSDLGDNKENIIATALPVVKADNLNSLHGSKLATIYQAPSAPLQSASMQEINPSTMVSLGSSLPQLCHEGTANSAQLPSDSSQLHLQASLVGLQAFLGSCRPSLSYLLPSWIHLGFKSDESFNEVMAWPLYEVITALDKWHFNGYITALEREILRIRFTQIQTNSV